MRTSLRTGKCLLRSAFPWRFSRSAFLCSMLLAPMGTAIEIPSDSLRTSDPSTTIFPQQLGPDKISHLTFAGGGGTYGRTIHASRTISLGIDSCTGIEQTRQIDSDFRFKNDFSDYGGELDIQANQKVHIGARGGWINETAHYMGSSLDPAVVDTFLSFVQLPESTFTTTYFNPYFSIEGKDVGWGLGVVFADNQIWRDKVRDYTDFDNASVFPTGHLRFGPLNRAYFKLSLWEGVPIYSGGGMFDIGMGVHPGPLELYAGYETGGPFTDGNVLLRGSLDVGDHLAAGAAFRLSSDSDSDFMPTISEDAASMFLTYKFIRH